MSDQYEQLEMFPEPRQESPAPPVVDLMQALQDSLDRAVAERRRP
jgi:hypothetical protein